MSTPRRTRPRARIFPLFLSSLLFAVVVPAASAASGLRDPSPDCRPRPAIRERAERLLRFLDSDDCGPGTDCFDTALVELEALLTAHPDDVALARSVQIQRARDPEDAARLRTETEALPEPGAEASPAERYLRDRILRSGESEPFVALADRAPDFPWGHWGAAVALHARAGASGEERDAARGHLARFLELCPSRTVDALWMRRLGADLFQGRLEDARSALSELPAPDRLRRQEHLWNLEFELAPVVEHGAVRTRIRADAVALEAMDRLDDEVWQRVVLSGWDLSGDASGLRRLEDRLLAESPCSSEGRRIRGERTSVELDLWAMPLEPARARRAADTVRSWIEQCPEVDHQAADWVAMLTVMEEPDPDDVRQAVELLLALESSTRAGDGSLTRDAGTAAARLLLETGVDADRAEEILARIVLDEEPAETDFARKARFFERVELDVLNGRVRLRKGDLDGAHHSLERAEAALDEPTISGDDSDFFLPLIRASVASLRGHVALAEGRTADAIAAWEITAEQHPSWARKVADLRASTADPASESGPSTRTVASVSGDALHTHGWQRVDEPMPEVELTDLRDGRVTPSPDSIDRPTLIALWATWCGPCQPELAEIQKLWEELGDDPEIAVTTWNVDEEIGRVQPHLDRRAWSFPTLSAWSWFRGLDVHAVPQTWIVDREGVVRLRKTGFEPGEAEAWREDVVHELRRLAARGIPED